MKVAMMCALVVLPSKRSAKSRLSTDSRRARMVAILSVMEMARP